MNFKMSDAYREIERHLEAQRQQDLAVPAESEDHTWPKLHRVSVLAGDRYVDYIRRQEARAGKPLPSAREMVGKLAEIVNRQPGDESENDL